MNILKGTHGFTGLIMACAILNSASAQAEAEGLYEAISNTKFNDASILKANGSIDSP